MSLGGRRAQLDTPSAGRIMPVRPRKSRFEVEGRAHDIHMFNEGKFQDARLRLLYMRRHYLATVIMLSVFAVLASDGCASTAVLRNSADTRPATVRTKLRAHVRKPHKHSKPRPAKRPATRNPTAFAQQALTAAESPLIREDGGHVAVAVDDLSTGAQAACGGVEEFVTASIVKVDILATLLYQGQQDGQALTPEERYLATTMIEDSDNNSATDLYDEDNGAEGIDEANRVFDLRETTVGTDGYWGLTTTTVDDQIRLLRQIFASPSVLTPESREYIQDLTSHVETGQQWGVPAAADPGTLFMVKNGWLPDPSLWEINSIGEITYDHQHMLIAVLSDDNADEDSGIALVEEAAKKAAESLAG